ncbi:MAG TPA: SIS domain-containing protein [Terriglobia bacterium]|jgi:glucosamine--fructose-6-phosphate aminotransferase (isomerizing)|nr:SIS domain-containing protein [Terriglobia bacterium]
MSFMMKEILDQPRALLRCYQAERKHVLAFRKFAEGKDFRLIVLVARGTSDNAALFGRYLLELTTGIPVSLCAPSVHTLYHAKLNFRNALVIGISQSGEGTDINSVLKSARRQGAFTVGITNEAKSTMAGLVDDAFFVRAGTQRSVAATKTYTGQLLMLYMLAAALGSHVTLERVEEIPIWVAGSLELVPVIRQIVERYRFMRQCIVVARGLNYANAFELSLKLMETCYVVAERFSAADFLHGPIAMVESDFPMILFMPPGKTYGDMKRLAVRVRKLGAETLIISSEGVRLPRHTNAIRVPAAIPEVYTPIPYIVPGQLFACLLAELKGIDPDKPRSLKIVTRTL